MYAGVKLGPFLQGMSQKDIIVTEWEGAKKLHSGLPYNLFCSLNIRVRKSRKIIWVGCAVRMGKMRNTCTS